jgi:hypothetical protein
VHSLEPASVRRKKQKRHLCFLATESSYHSPSKWKRWPLKWKSAKTVAVNESLSLGGVWAKATTMNAKRKGSMVSKFGLNPED